MADSWWNPSWLFGGPERVPGTPVGPQPIAPAAFGQNRPFPSQEDLALARKSGEFQHTGEFTPNTFQVNRGQVQGGRDAIQLATALGALGAPTDPGLIDTLGRNKLASRRSAIVSLAANDPNDQVVGAKDFNYEDVFGETRVDRKGDKPMFTFFGAEPTREDQSTPTHEAAHRSMYKLVEALGNEPDPSEDLRRVREYYIDPNTQELAVRALMHDVYGDPEAADRSERFTRFVEGKNPGAFGGTGEDLEYARQMNALAEAYAQRMIHARKPGGPW